LSFDPKLSYEWNVKNLKLILVFGITLAVVAAFYFKKEIRVNGREPLDTKQSRSNLPNSISNFSEPESENQALGSVVSKNGDEVLAQEKVAQISTFVKREAKALDRTNNQTEAKTIELRRRALNLDTIEKEHLKAISVTPAEPINERILSVYLLTLTSDVESQNLVSAIAQTPVPELGPINPHSEAEVKHAQELALRYMAIDKLVDDYKTNPPQSQMAMAALQRLQDQSAQNPSPQVRKYANDELNKITK
jgi:hypothetical protein